MGENKAKSADIWWSWTGKVAVLVGLIWGLIQIVNAIFPADEYKLDASGYCSEIALPDSFIVGNDALRSLDSTWWLTIENNGAKEVTDLTLEVPFDGFYSVEQIGATAVFSSFDGTISLGSLRPSKGINVTLWSKFPNFPARTWCTGSNYDKTRLTHPNGVAGIVYTEKATGIVAWFISTDRKSGRLLSLVFFFSLVVLAFVAFAVAIDKLKPKPKSLTVAGEVDEKQEKLL